MHLLEILDLCSRLQARRTRRLRSSSPDTNMTNQAANLSSGFSLERERLLGTNCCCQKMRKSCNKVARCIGSCCSLAAVQQSCFLWNPDCCCKVYQDLSHELSMDLDTTIDLTLSRIVLFLFFFFCRYFFSVDPSKDLSEMRGNYMVNLPQSKLAYLAYCYSTIMKSAGRGYVDGLLPHRKREVVTHFTGIIPPIRKKSGSPTSDR